MRRIKKVDLPEVVLALLAQEIIDKGPSLIEHKRLLISEKEIASPEGVQSIKLIWGNALEKSLAEARSGLETLISELFLERPLRLVEKEGKESFEECRNTIREDSNNDQSEDEDGPMENSSTLCRKNRKGQRARRAEWEQRYGADARHLVKPESLHKSGNYPVAIRVKENAPKESLHPSWEAKRKQKEALKINLNNPSANTRIKFEDN